MRLRRLAGAAAVTGALMLAPAPAAAGSGATAAAEPAGSLVRTQITGAHRLDGRPYLVAGERLRLRGVVRPRVEGGEVVVRIDRGPRRVLERRVPVRTLPGSADGSWRLSLRAPRGRVTIRAVAVAAENTPAARAPVRRISVVSAALRPRASGVLARLLQRGLARLRYAVPRSGAFDAGTQRAVIAYRKVNGMSRTPALSRAVLSGVLAGRGGFEVRAPQAGRHAEADISRQVMALVDGNGVHRVYHVSSGAPATPTILGTFRVYRKEPGTNGLGMVDSSYFRGGYAIHGYASVPTYNASHGCLRVPVPDARHVYDWLRIGDRVVVYP